MSIATLLWKQFTDSTLVYISEGAPGNFFNSPQPYLTFLGALFFLLGLGVAFQQILKPTYMFVLVWFWAVIVFGGVLTLDAPANTRMVMTTPAVALLVAIEIMKIAELLGHLGVRSSWQAGLSSAIILILGVQNAVFYFGEYRAGNYFNDANAELAQEAGLQMQGLDSDYTLYMLAQPRMFSGFPTIPFLAPEHARTDIRPGDVTATEPTLKLPAFLVATPDNLAALRAIATRYPGGVWTKSPRKTKAEVLYYGYTVPAP